MSTDEISEAPKCSKIRFRLGSAPNPTGGAHSTSPDPVAALRKPTSKGKESRRENKKTQRKEGWGH